MEQRGFTADSRDPLLCEHNVPPLEGMRQTGPLDRYITEVERNAGAHQWIRLVADAKSRCGSVELPEEPSLPIASPALTWSPTWTRTLAANQDCSAPSRKATAR